MCNSERLMAEGSSILLGTFILSFFIRSNHIEIQNRASSLGRRIELQEHGCPVSRERNLRTILIQKRSSPNQFLYKKASCFDASSPIQHPTLSPSHGAHSASDICLSPPVALSSRCSCRHPPEWCKTSIKVVGGWVFEIFRPDPRPIGTLSQNGLGSGIPKLIPFLSFFVVSSQDLRYA